MEQPQKATSPRHFITYKFVAYKKTMPDKKCWRCAHVPCKIISNNGEILTLKPFNGKEFTIDIAIFEKELYVLKNDETYVYTPYYPTERIAISEFDIKHLSILNLKKYFEEKDNYILKAIEKAEQDSYHSKGNNSCITFDKYTEYKSNPTTSKLERIGDPIFNRSVRHSPPIYKHFTREEYEQTPSFPAPIGIRYDDFALPSEQNNILRDILNQIFSCKNAPECPKQIIDELGLTIVPNTHTCLWCGNIIDISELNQEYCSKEHSINFCHRIPELGTKRGNVYFGHCSCNREQGGYSELQRIEQIIQLAKCNPEYKEKILKELG